MKRGIATIALASEATVAAQSSGVRLGVGQQAPALLRLFRLSGTSIVAVSAVTAAQLIAVRAAAAGTPVLVLTGRPQIWQALTFSSRLGRIHAPYDQPLPPDGPSLLVDDRPPQARRAIESAPWQCRLDVRTEWTRQEITGFAHADLTLFGGLPADLTAAIASTYRISQQLAGGLTHLEPGVVGVARRGLLDLVRIDPTPAESAALGLGHGAGAHSAWR